MTEKQKREVRNLIKENVPNDIIVRAVGITAAELEAVIPKKRRRRVIMEEGYEQRSREIDEEAPRTKPPTHTPQRVHQPEQGTQPNHHSRKNKQKGRGSRRWSEQWRKGETAEGRKKRMAKRKAHRAKRMANETPEQRIARIRRQELKRERKNQRRAEERGESYRPPPRNPEGMTETEKRAEIASMTRGWNND